MMVSSSPWRVLVTKEGQALKRLDTWLASQVAELSRRRAQALIDKGEVTIDGLVCKKSARLFPDSEVAIWSRVSPPDWTPEPDPSVLLNVIYEDEVLIAIDKPSGIPSQPLSPEELGTLANGLVARFPECAGIGRSRGDGGLVQRLDRETSGVILAARSEPVHKTLVRQQLGGKIEKIYLAIVRRSQHPLPLIIDDPLLPAGRGRHKVKPNPRGVPATTRIRLKSTHDDWLLVEAKILKGQRHQIRAHLAGAGFPIAGDPVYGPGETPIPRLMLHAEKLRLDHPTRATRLTLTSPMPREFDGILKKS